MPTFASFTVVLFCHVKPRTGLFLTTHSVFSENMYNPSNQKASGHKPLLHGRSIKNSWGKFSCFGHNSCWTLPCSCWFVGDRFVSDVVWGISGCWKGSHTWRRLEGEVPMGQLSDRRRRLLWLGSQGCSSTAACFSGRREGLNVQKYQAWCIHVPFLSLYRQGLTTPNIVSTGKGAEEQHCSTLTQVNPC